MKICGFTLIEVLVVIAITALLAAIAAPLTMAARHRTYSLRCSSNLRQLSLGFLIYQKEYNRLPYGFCDVNLSTHPAPVGGYVGETSDKQGWWWFHYLRLTMDFNLTRGSIAWCPAGKYIQKTLKPNILCGNYGVNRSICKDAQGAATCRFVGKPFHPSRFKTPSTTFVISDSGYSLLSFLAASDNPEPVFENPNRLNFFYVPGLKQNQNRPELKDNPDAIKGRHPHQTLNIGFADGHHEVRPAESLRINQIITTEKQLPSPWKP
jgi:prepilin-type N-terminal cleavage/methylation domain-containing protein/prepilin-type processing-associated H-X9-DG protein